MNDGLAEPVSESLPGWIIARAAAYMLRRYGSAAGLRAAARHRLLLDRGEHEAAADWQRVSEEIERLGIAQGPRPRGRGPGRMDGRHSGD